MANREETGVKKIKKSVLVIGFALLVITGADCGGEDHGNGDGRDQETPLPVDHAFTNGQSFEGEFPGDLHESGPVITDLEFVPGNPLIQGQTISLSVDFTDPEMDLTAPSFLLQVRGLPEPEYWTLDSEQCGGIIESTAIFRLEISRYFEPGVFIIKMALMDDAGHIGNWYSTVFIIVPYVTPEIVELLPEDGASDVPLNTVIWGFLSKPVVGEPLSFTLFRQDIEVSGSIRLLPNMKEVTLAPDEFLVPEAEYVATLTVGEPMSGEEHTRSHRFSTGPAIPCPDVTGRVYSLVIGAENIIEPSGAEIIFNLVSVPTILIKIKSFDEMAGTLGSLGAIGSGDPLDQNPICPLMKFPEENAILVNPYFSTGPSFFNIGILIGVEANIYNFSLSGEFSPDGDSFEHGILTGYLDVEELNETISEFLGTSWPFDVCNLLPGTCDTEGHLPFRAEDIGGLYEPGIGDFYDLSVEVNPESIVGADGGTVTVFGEFTVNGDPSGTHSVDLSATEGTFPGGGSSFTVDTSDGVYSVLLTVPGGLSPGEDIIITASADSPIGIITRSTSLLVE
jgi:hypothetical protein